IKYIANNQLTAVLMHNLAIHANPNIIINRELNVFNEICIWANEKINLLQQENIAKSQIIFDPGIGFSKDAKQSLRIIKNIESYRILGTKIMVGHSKNSFLDLLKIPKKPDLTRDEKTLIISKYLAEKNVDYLRVHEVLNNIKAILN
ncbi:MAG: dihydropteroate synthase, partial [Alphaproteobacteria bacterium]